MTRRLQLTTLPHFIINCDSHTERRAFMEQQMHEWGLSYQFVRAVEADNVSAVTALSHLGALHMARESTPFVVLEDDCRLYPIWGHEFTLPDDARLFYPGNSIFGTDVPGELSWGGGALVVEYFDDRLLRVRNMLGGHAICYLDREIVDLAMRNILDGLFHHQYQFPVDVAFATLQNEHLALTYHHPMCEQAAEHGGQQAATLQSLLPWAVGRPS